MGGLKAILGIANSNKNKYHIHTHWHNLALDYFIFILFFICLPPGGESLWLDRLSGVGVTRCLCIVLHDCSCNKRH